MDEFKILTVVFDAALEKEVYNAIESHGVHEYVVNPDLKGSWEAKVKHMNTHIWPGKDSLLRTILKKEKCYEVVEALERIRKGMNYKVTFLLVVEPVEYFSR